VFKVTGELAGGPGCSATFTYDGLINAGSTCSLTTFQGRATGLPTVRRFAGNGITLFGPARLYDKDGNVVGSEEAQAVTPYNLAHLKDCDTPQGFTKGSFSSVIVLIQERG
jgi:hypothetical protein